MNRTMLATLTGAAAVFTLCLVTACSDSGGPPPGKSDTPDPNRAPTPVADEGFESTTPGTKSGG